MFCVVVHKDSNPEKSVIFFRVMMCFMWSSSACTSRKTSETEEGSRAA